MSDLAQQSVHQALGNAGIIIEKFGGIRPMAAKMNVAVTTVQGWKKRDAIPANRLEAVFEAAQRHGIALPPDFPIAANDSVHSQLLTPQVQLSRPSPTHEDSFQQIRAGHAAMAARRSENQGASKGFTELLIEDGEAKKLTKGLILSFGLIGMVLIAIAATLIPRTSQQVDTTTFDQEADLQVAKVEETAFKGLVPEDWSEQLQTLRDQATTAAKDVGDSVAVIQEDLIGENAGTTSERLVKLEKYVNNVVGENTFSGLSKRYEDFNSSMAGQQSLSQSMNALHGMVFGEGGEPVSDEELELKLDEARQEDPSLSETFSGVPSEDLKAAAMLLAMTQVRDTLNREGVPFNKDLQTLMGMIGNDDVELRSALEKLAPTAEKGILTPKGLSDEFRALAGEALSDTLNGEEVTVYNKARAKMNDIFQVEKNGEMISGTRSQRIIEKASREIELGNIQSAIDFLRDQLRAKELEPLRPFIRRLESAISASSVQEALQRAIDLQAGEGYLGGSQLLKKESR